MKAIFDETRFSFRDEDEAPEAIDGEHNPTTIHVVEGGHRGKRFIIASEIGELGTAASLQEARLRKMLEEGRKETHARRDLKIVDPIEAQERRQKKGTAATKRDETLNAIEAEAWAV